MATIQLVPVFYLVNRGKVNRPRWTHATPGEDGAIAICSATEAAEHLRKYGEASIPVTTLAEHGWATLVESRRQSYAPLGIIAHQFDCGGSTPGRIDEYVIAVGGYTATVYNER